MRFLEAVPPRAGTRTTVPFRYEHDSILIADASINGIRVTALFDTGFNGAFNIMTPAIAALGLQEEFDLAQPRTAMGYSGRSTSREGNVAEVRLGDLVVRSPSVIFWEAATGHDSTAWSFAVGNGFLEDYVVTIDYRERRIHLD